MRKNKFQNFIRRWLFRARSLPGTASSLAPSKMPPRQAVKHFAMHPMTLILTDINIRINNFIKYLFSSFDKVYTCHYLTHGPRTDEQNCRILIARIAINCLLLPISCSKKCRSVLNATVSSIY